MTRPDRNMPGSTYGGGESFPRDSVTDSAGAYAPSVRLGGGCQDRHTVTVQKNGHTEPPEASRT